MPSIELECCVDEIVESSIKAVQAKIFISPVIFVFTEENVYVLDTAKEPDPDKALTALNELHKKINHNSWIDIFAAQCKINEDDEVLKSSSDEGTNAIVFVPITPDKKNHQARILPFNDSKNTLFYPERLIDLTQDRLQKLFLSKETTA